MKRRTFLTAAGSSAVMTALPITGYGSNEGWIGNNHSEVLSFAENIANCGYGGDVDETTIRQMELAEQNLYDLLSACPDRYFQNFEPVLINSVFEGTSGCARILTQLRQLLGDLSQSGLFFLSENPTIGKLEFARRLALFANDSNLQPESGKGSIVGFFSLNTQPISNTGLRFWTRRLKRQHNVGLFVVDPLQYVSLPKGMAGPNRGKSKIIQNLKTLAAELNVPVLAIDRTL